MDGDRPSDDVVHCVERNLFIVFVPIERYRYTTL